MFGDQFGLRRQFRSGRQVPGEDLLADVVGDLLVGRGWRSVDGHPLMLRDWSGCDKWAALIPDPRVLS
jgi:hypothetical protein